jgi:hypothetical protein
MAAIAFSAQLIILVCNVLILMLCTILTPKNVYSIVCSRIVKNVRSTLKRVRNAKQGTQFTLGTVHASTL